MNKFKFPIIAAVEGIDDASLKSLVDTLNVRIRPFQAENKSPEAAYDVLLTSDHDRAVLHPHLPLIHISKTPDPAVFKPMLERQIEQSLNFNFSFVPDLANSQMAQFAKGSGKPLNEMMQFVASNLEVNVDSLSDAYHAEAWDEIADHIHKVRPTVRMLGALELADLLQTAEHKIKQGNYAWIHINGSALVAALKELVQRAAAMGAH